MNLFKEYSILFEMLIYDTKNVDENVFRITLGNYVVECGDTNPIVLITPSREISIVSCINGSAYKEFKSTNKVPLNSWQTVEILQKPIEGGRQYQLKINVPEIYQYSTINNDARDFFNMKVFAADKYTEASGRIRKINITTIFPGSFCLKN